MKQGHITLDLNVIESEVITVGFEALEHLLKEHSLTMSSDFEGIKIDNRQIVEIMQYITKKIDQRVHQQTNWCTDKNCGGFHNEKENRLQP